MERDSAGRISSVRWEPSSGFGTLQYQLSLHSDDLPEVNGVWAMTTGQRVDAGDLPFDTGIFAPGQQVTVPVRAFDVHYNFSPPTELTLTCCDF